MFLPTSYTDVGGIKLLTFYSKGYIYIMTSFSILDNIEKIQEKK